jgi:hypothetical protein
VTLTVGDPAARRHQFLISLERAHGDGSFSLDTGIVSVRDVQRERGEIAVEGVGTLELAAQERDGMHRIDVRELDRTASRRSVGCRRWPHSVTRARPPRRRASPSM